MLSQLESMEPRELVKCDIPVIIVGEQDVSVCYRGRKVLQIAKKGMT